MKRVNRPIGMAAPPAVTRRFSLATRSPPVERLHSGTRVDDFFNRPRFTIARSKPFQPSIRTLSRAVRFAGRIEVASTANSAEVALRLHRSPFFGLLRASFRGVGLPSAAASKTATWRSRTIRPEWALHGVAICRKNYLRPVPRKRTAIRGDARRTFW